MFKVNLYKRLIVLLGSIVMICALSVTEAQDTDKPFMRLATYWDAPGQVTAISADDQWIVIYDRNIDLSQLVEVATGGVLATGQGENSIRFSPMGRFVVVGLRELKSTLIINLSTKQSVVQIPESSVIFSADESLLMFDQYDEAISEYITKVVETKTGNIRLEIKGLGYSFSPDAKLITVTDTVKKIAKIIEIETGKTLFEFSLRDYSEGQTWNFTFRFSPDGQLVSINQLHDGLTYVIDIATREILYNVYGFATFSSDSRYLKVRQSDGGAAPNVLLEAKTGKQLDKVYGEMWFSDDSKLLYRRDATNCAYKGYMKVLELPSMQPLVDIQKCVGFALVANNSVMEVYDEDIIAPQTHQFIDVATGKVLWQVEVVRTEMIDYERHLIQFTKRYRETIEDFVSGEVLVTEREITLSHNRQLAFASNGMFVDVYGSADARVDTMPAPRQGSGIVQAPKGTFTVYPTQDVTHPIQEESINVFTFAVMGQSADDKWLFVTYTSNQPENRRKAVWIFNQNLTVIEDWHDVPILDASDPLASLREMSEKN